MGRPANSPDVWTPDLCERVRAMIVQRMTARQVSEAIGLTYRAVIRGVGKRELGPWLSPSGYAPDDTIPSDFPELFASGMHMQALAKHYRRSPATITRWRVRLGLVRGDVRKIAKPVKPKAPIRGIVNRPQLGIGVTAQHHRDMSLVGQAADVLRRDCPVYRCRETGAADPKGTHWRCGRLILTDHELLERAARKGWKLAA